MHSNFGVWLCVCVYVCVCVGRIGWGDFEGQEGEEGGMNELSQEINGGGGVLVRKGVGIYRPGGGYEWVDSRE